MDIPNGNWDVLKPLSEYREENGNWDVLKPLSEYREENGNWDVLNPSSEYREENGNWDVLKPLSAYREEKEYPGNMNIRSSNSHIVLGALQTGISSQNLGLQKIFHKMHSHFKESPARIDDKLLNLNV